MGRLFFLFLIGYLWLVYVLFLEKGGRGHMGCVFIEIRKKEI
jgi:hypothetical protein